MKQLTCSIYQTHGTYTILNIENSKDSVLVSILVVFSRGMISSNTGVKDFVYVHNIKLM